MKKLAILDNSGVFKVDDSDTLIPFGAFINSSHVKVDNSEKAEFRIKNMMGYVMSTPAQITNSGYVINLNTKNLTNLVPDDYQVEVAITDSNNNVAIYPDNGFVTITITDNALTVTGQQLSYISLDEFKKYINDQLSQSETDIKNDFNNYVSQITNSTVNQATQASSDAKKALDTVNANSSMVTANSTMLQTVSNIVNGIFPGYDLPVEYHSGQITDLNNLPLGIHTINGWIDYMANMTNFPDFAKNTWGTFIVLPIGQPGTKGSWQLYYGGGNAIYTRERTPGTSTFGPWAKMGG